MKKLIIYISLLSVVVVSFFVSLFVQRKIVVNLSSDVRHTEMKATTITNSGQYSYKFDPKGEAIIEGSLYSRESGILAIHDEEYIYWEGMLGEDVTIDIRINYSERRPLSERFKTSLKE